MPPPRSQSQRGAPHQTCQRSANSWRLHAGNSCETIRVFMAMVLLVVFLPPLFVQPGVSVPSLVHVEALSPAHACPRPRLPTLHVSREPLAPETPLAAGPSHRGHLDGQLHQSSLKTALCSPAPTPSSPDLGPSWCLGCLPGRSLTWSGTSDPRPWAPLLAQGRAGWEGPEITFHTKEWKL